MTLKNTEYEIFFNVVWCDVRLAPGFATVCRSVVLII